MEKRRNQRNKTRKSREKHGQCASVSARGKLGLERGGAGGEGQNKSHDQSRVMTLIIFPNKLPDKKANQHLWLQV